MPNNNQSLNAGGLILAIIVVGIILYNYKSQIQSIKFYFSNLGSYIWFYLVPTAIVLIFLLFLWLFTHLSYKSIKKVSNKIEEKKDEAIAKQEETEEIENLLEEKLPIDQKELISYIERLRGKIKSCKEYKLSFTPEIKKWLAKAIELLEELEKQELVEARKTQAEEVEKKYEEAVMKREIEERGEKEYTRTKLKMYENNVYKKKGLTKIQQEILIENDYKQINEYCAYERDFITVFVKPELNHSPTHEFLVWSVKRLLERIKDVKNIQDHLTKNADITFKYHNKKYALEIELGSLLRKQKQLNAKVKYLNDIFKNRWMFIVSNKNLLAKYKKYGFATPRNRVYENLAKMLRIEHLDFSGVKPHLPSAGEWY